MGDILKLKVPGKPEYVSTVRLAVSSLASKVGLDIEQVEDVKVAVSEACNNIVIHKKAGCEEVIYDVVCEINDDRLTVSVEDECGGFDIENYSEPDLSQTNESGLGVFIIRALMDDVDISTELGAGTVIRMTKYLNAV